MDTILIIVFGAIIGVLAGIGFYLFLMEMEKRKLVKTVEAKLDSFIEYFRSQPRIAFHGVDTLMFLIPYSILLGGQYVLQFFNWLLGNAVFSMVLWLVLLVVSFIGFAAAKHYFLLKLKASFTGTKNVACHLKTPDKTESIFLSRWMPPIECDWPRNYLQSLKDYVKREKKVDIAGDLARIKKGKVHLYYDQTWDEKQRALFISVGKTWDELYQEDGNIPIETPAGDTITLSRAAMQWKFLKYEPVMSNEKIFEKLNMDNMMLPMFVIGGDGVTTQEIEAGFSNYDYRVGALARQKEKQLESENTKLKILLQKKGLDEDTMNSIATVAKIEKTQAIAHRFQMPMKLRKYLPWIMIVGLIALVVVLLAF
jgi:hypothetical protein